MKYKKYLVKISQPIKSFNHTINVDSDKSISIRSFLIGSISHDISKISNALNSEDVQSTIICLKSLGVKIKKTSEQNYDVYGKGLGSLMATKKTSLNFGNSGTLARLLIGILTSTPNIKIKMQGDHSLNKRSMEKLIKCMSEFGAKFIPKKKYKFPLTMISSDMPVAIEYKAGVSAQLKSAVILSALNSFGNTKIYEEELSRDHTENILMRSPTTINIKKINKKRIIKIFGKRYLNPLKLKVPGDPSSAAFFTALTLLNKNSNLIIKDVCLNPKRIGFYKILKAHGAKIHFKNLKKINNEFRGDINVKSSKLRPIKASKKYYVSATDEYPILFVIAALTSGVSIFKGIKDLSNKESSRAEEMKKILNQINIKCKSTKDEMKIWGVKQIQKNNPSIFVPNLGDHRICMSATILSLITGVKAKIKNFETVNTSSPSFLKIIKYLGGKYEIKKA